MEKHFRRRGVCERIQRHAQHALPGGIATGERFRHAHGRNLDLWIGVTGGLDDSVIDISADQQNANGIKFTEFSVRALAKAIRKALVLFEHPDLLREYQYNGIRADFSWDRTARMTLDVYEAVLGEVPRSPSR